MIWEVSDLASAAFAGDLSLGNFPVKMSVQSKGPQRKTVRSAMAFNLGIQGMKKLIAGLCGAALLSSAAVGAEGPTELRPYLGGGLQYVPTDNSNVEERLSDEGFGLFAGMGAPLSRRFAIEGNMYYDTWDRGSPVNNREWRDYGVEAAGLLTFPSGTGWVPYLTAALGVAKSRLVDEGSSKDFNYSAGLGAFYLFEAFGRDWGMRLDARYRYIDLGDHVFGRGSITTPGLEDPIEEPMFRFGILTFIGPRVAPVAPVVAAVGPSTVAYVEPILDSDADGIFDDKDQCPDTGKGVKIDAKGCPAAVQVGDGDNVIKSYGPIYFEYNKADIVASERTKLDAAARDIKGMKQKILVRLFGHTDDVGTPEYNLSLGERRANTVKSYLLSKGVPSNKIEVSSFGESKPAVDNATDAGRAQNRRVEVLAVAD